MTPGVEKLSFFFALIKLRTLLCLFDKSVGVSIGLSKADINIEYQ